jgi:hypothetical protein
MSNKITRKRNEKPQRPKNQCGIFVSYKVDKNNKCNRYIACNIAEYTKSINCPAKGGK